MSTEARFRTLAIVGAAWPWAFSLTGGLTLRLAKIEATDTSTALLVAMAFLGSTVLGWYAASRLGRSGVAWGLLGGLLFGGLPLFVLAAIGNSGQASEAASEAETKRKLIAKVAALYSYQYLLDRGSMPPHETVIEWMVTMEALSVHQIVDLGADMVKCKRMLERR